MDNLRKSPAPSSSAPPSPEPCSLSPAPSSSAPPSPESCSLSPAPYIVFMFPGQGSQYPGMGRSLYENSPAARAVFDLAEKIRPGTIELCFAGSDGELARTENTQPCLYCADLAAAAALKEAGVSAGMLAGFSLGELAALAFSGAVSYEDGFRLVCKRAELMQKAAEASSSVMLAVLKLPAETVEAICAEFSDAYPVNYNCPGQIVAACGTGGAELFKAKVKEAGGKVMPLKTSGGFHSPFMAGAADDFAEVLKKYDFGPPAVPVYSNFTAKPYEGDLGKLLVKQICSPVQWETAVKNMIAAGASTFIETGPGKSLRGLVSRISGEVRVFNVENLESLQITIEQINS